MKYSKVHTCDFADERDVESGKEFKVCDFEGIKLGIMICYDREYPESARILMLKGAEIIWYQMIVVPCNQESEHFPQGHMKIWLQSLWQIRMEIMLDVPVHIVQFAGIEKENVLITQFCWLMIKPRDFYAEFDMEVIREYRNREMLGNTFRKIEAYSQLLSKEIKEPFIRDGQNR